MSEQTTDRAARVMCAEVHSTYLMSPCSVCRRAAKALARDGSLLPAGEAATNAAAVLRAFADSRGVNVGDEDDDWWRGYRQAQRECARDASALLASSLQADVPTP